jgi:hypothetical protein
MTARIPPARPEEAGALRALARRAYAPWIPAVSREPEPRGENHAARIAAGRAFAPESPGGLGFVETHRATEKGFHRIHMEKRLP